MGHEKIKTMTPKQNQAYLAKYMLMFRADSSMRMMCENEINRLEKIYNTDIPTQYFHKDETFRSHNIEKTKKVKVRNVSHMTCYGNITIAEAIKITGYRKGTIRARILKNTPLSLPLRNCK